jgi:Cu-processing system permease protein
MTVLSVARDVVKEAFASKLMLGLFVAIALALVVVWTSLDLDVVDGALAGSRLFGKATGSAVVPVDVFLRPAFQLLAYGTFYVGLLFGVVVTADVAPRMLQPGRVELMLALPVRRVELVLGLYTGVAAICAVATTAAVGGVSAVLFAKAKFVSFAPAAGAAMAFIGFCAIYAAMLAVGALFRSPALSAGTGLVVYALGIASAQKNTLLMATTNKVVRVVVEGILTPLPNLPALADVGAGVAVGETVALTAALPVVGGAFAFAAFGVLVACAVVQSKDY